MSRTLHVVADPWAVSMAAAVRAAAWAAPLLVLTVPALGDLAEELASMDAAAGLHSRPVPPSLGRGDLPRPARGCERG